MLAYRFIEARKRPLDKEFLEELFAPFGEVQVRSMFGGKGIFRHGLNFAAVMDGTLRLKADETTKDRFEAEGMEPWHYTRKDGQVTVMQYWQVPERLLDDPVAFADWAAEAFEVALRADGKKPASKRKYQDPMRAD